MNDIISLEERARGRWKTHRPVADRFAEFKTAFAETNDFEEQIATVRRYAHRSSLEEPGIPDWVDQKNAKKGKFFKKTITQRIKEGVAIDEAEPNEEGLAEREIYQLIYAGPRPGASLDGTPFRITPLVTIYAHILTGRYRELSR